MTQSRLSSSNSSLTIAGMSGSISLSSNAGSIAARPQSLPGAEHLLPLAADSNRISSSCTPDNHLREEFTLLAKDGENSSQIFLTPHGIYPFRVQANKYK